MALARNRSTLDRCHGKQHKELKKGLLVYLNVMYMPQLMGFDPYPSAHVGEISYIWSIWGPFLLILIQKWSYFKWLLRKICQMCRAGGKLKGVMDHGDFEFWGFKKVGGHHDVMNGDQRKKYDFFDLTLRLELMLDGY